MIQENDNLVHSNKIYQHSLHLLFPESYLNTPLADANAFESGLGIYLLSLNIFEDALERFFEKKYSNFDALTGNNSCYLVAYIIFILATRFERDERFQDNGIKLIKKIRFVKRKIKNLKLEFSNIKNKELTLLDYILENNLDINADINFTFLCLSFGCSIIKEKTIDNFEEINYQILFEKYRHLIHFDLKKKSVIKLVKHWQKNISFINIRTIQEHSKVVQSTDKEWVKYIHDPYILADERGRLCTPSLYAQRVIYNLLLTISKAIIGLQINIIDESKKYLSRFTLYYEVGTGGVLKQIRNKEVPENQPIYMFAGCRYLISNECERNIYKIEKEFNEKNLKDLIFAHEVTYPQYPKSLKAKNIEPEEYEIAKEILRLKQFKGFSLEDPSDICIAHIFTDLSSNQLLSFNDPPLYLPILNPVINA